MARPRGLKPITGTYVVPEKLKREQTLTASQAFDFAWKDACDQAAKQWGKPLKVEVAVTYHARIDTWNPGGIGVCGVTISPIGP